MIQNMKKITNVKNMGVNQINVKKLHAFCAVYQFIYRVGWGR